MTEEPIRILQVIGIMNRGGAETMVMNLYRNMDRSKVQFDFVENSFEPAAFDAEITSLGGKIYRCPHYTGKNHFTYKNWWNKFFKEHRNEYKVIHGHIGSTAAIYLGIAKKYGLYTIAHSHSSGTDYSLKSMLYKLISYNTRNIADYFFACSSIAGKDRYGEKVIHSSNYRVLNNAIDTKQFQFDEKVREIIRSQLGITSQILMGHVGRFTKEKNHTFLLEIFKAMHEMNPNSRLILVGDGPLRVEVEQQALSLGIKDFVIFTGIRSDVNRLVQGMDVFVFPSIYEGLPVTLVETQTSGLSCVISDKVPAECILVKNLVTIKSLDESPKEWAEHILSKIDIERKDKSAEIIANGYDIAETAKWLGGFYLGKYNER